MTPLPFADPKHPTADEIEHIFTTSSVREQFLKEFGKLADDGFALLKNDPNADSSLAEVAMFCTLWEFGFGQKKADELQGILFRAGYALGFAAAKAHNPEPTVE